MHVIKTHSYSTISSRRSESEQVLSAEWSSFVNSAYKTLSSSIKRAEYLLEMHNITISEENSDVDKEFLLEMMDRNEEVTFVRQQSNYINKIECLSLIGKVEDANDRKQLEDLLTKTRNDYNECVQQLEKALIKNDLEAARKHVITLRYFISLENSIKEKGNKIGIVL